MTESNQFMQISPLHPAGTCPKCGFCDKCGRSEPLPAPSWPSQSYWYCWRCGRQHGMYEVCPAGTPVTYTFTSTSGLSQEKKP